MITYTQNPTIPTAVEAELARLAVQSLAPQLAKMNGQTQISVTQDGAVVTTTVPTEALRLFVSALGEMGDGHAIRIVPQHTELTTQEAADILNVSRPYLVKLLDEGKMPSHMVGTHRRVMLKDLMVYKMEHRRLREAALDELSDLDQELGLM